MILEQFQMSSVHGTSYVDLKGAIDATGPIHPAQASAASQIQLQAQTLHLQEEQMKQQQQMFLMQQQKQQVL